jgi:hypothetical protein
MNTKITLLPMPPNLGDTWLQRLARDPIGELTRLPQDTANTATNAANDLLNKGGDELTNTISSIFDIVAAFTGQGQVPAGQTGTYQQRPTVNYAPYILGGTVLLAGGLLLIANQNKRPRRRR